MASPLAVSGTTLFVEPPELAQLARNLADLVNQTKTQVPTARVQSAGGDPMSPAPAERITKQGAQLTQLADEFLRKLHSGARAIGSAAEVYSSSDPDAAERIARAYGGRTSTVGGRIPNPVAADAGIAQRDEVPSGSTSLPVGAGNDHPETFARALESGGDKGGSAREFDSVFMTYATGQHHQVLAMIDRTQARLQDWQPVGTDVASLFKQVRAWLDKLEESIGVVAERARNYHEAHTQLREDHPQEATLKQAREHATDPSLTPAQRAAAQQQLNELINRGFQAQQQYRDAIELQVRDEDMGARVGTPPDIAAGTDSAVQGTPPTPRRGTRGFQGAPPQNGTRDNRNGTGEKRQGENGGLNDLLNSLAQQLGNSPADSELPPAAEQTAAQTANTAAQSGANTPQIPDLSKMMNQGSNAGLSPEDGLFDDPLGEPLDYASGPGGFGGGGGGVGGVPTAAVGGAPLSTTSGSTTSKTPADVRQFGMPATASTKAGPGGMPMIPPYMGGMGGGNNGQDRKTLFAEDTKIVPDDELPTGLASAVVNEKPAVLPPEAKATRLTADRTSATNEGGTA